MKASIMFWCFTFRNLFCDGIKSNMTETFGEFDYGRRRATFPILALPTLKFDYEIFLWSPLKLQSHNSIEMWLKVQMH